MKIKVLHLPTAYPDPARGAPFSSIFVKEHILSVSPYCENRVLYISPDPPSTKRLVELVRTVEDGIPTDRMYVRTMRPLWITNIYFRVAVAAYLLRLMIVERFCPDIVHVHYHQAGLAAILFCKLFRMKMVTTEHWTAFVGFPELPPQRFKQAAKVFEFSRHVLPVSDHLLRGIEAKTGLSLFRKSTVVNNVVDTALFHDDRSASIAQRKTVLVVARLDEQKDLPNLFRAIRILKDRGLAVRVRIIGKGDRDHYSRMTGEYEIREHVEFLGEKTKAAIAEEMRMADVLCLSSIAENSPCVIGEALSTGLPVVSTNVGGIPELVDDSNGILVPPRNPERLADALHTALFERKFNRQEISTRAKEHFSYQTIGKKIHDTYMKVMS